MLTLQNGASIEHGQVVVSDHTPKVKVCPTAA